MKKIYIIAALAISVEIAAAQNNFYYRLTYVSQEAGEDIKVIADSLGEAITGSLPIFDSVIKVGKEFFALVMPSRFQGSVHVSKENCLSLFHLIPGKGWEYLWYPGAGFSRILYNRKQQFWYVTTLDNGTSVLEFKHFFKHKFI